MMHLYDQVVYGLFLARNKSFMMSREEIEENYGVWEGMLSEKC